MLMINNLQQFQQGQQRLSTPLVQQQVNQQVRPPVFQQCNPQFNQYTPPHASPLLSQPPFNPQYPPPYPGQWPQHPPSVHSNITETSKLITQVLDRQFKLYQDREDTHKECERWKEERKKKFRDDNNKRNKINKAFKKVNRFDGSNPDQCLPWMEEIFAMAHYHKRNAREELLYNSDGSVQKTLYSLSPEATEDEIQDLLLQNHSNLKLHLSIYLLFNLSNKDLKSHYRHTMQDTSHSMSCNMKALPLKVMDPKLAASIMPTLYMGNLMRWKRGSTRKPTGGIQEDHGL